MSKGKHTLEWRYVKDKENSEGDDKAFIDNILFPSQAVIKPFEAVSDLDAKIQDNKLVLTWTANENAENYIVRRDGEIVSTQSETVYYEDITKGIFTYSVVAKKGDTYSTPAFVILNLNNDLTENISDVVLEKISVYPNPASDIIYVDVDESFNAVIYNYQGQVVKNVIVDNGQINVSDLANGIYFIEIRTVNCVSVNKVLVK